MSRKQRMERLFANVERFANSVVEPVEVPANGYWDTYRSNLWLAIDAMPRFGGGVPYVEFDARRGIFIFEVVIGDVRRCQFRRRFNYKRGEDLQELRRQVELFCAFASDINFPPEAAP